VEYNGTTYKKSGLILFNETHVLVIKSRKGSLSFPKGGIEEKDIATRVIDTLHNAGQREMKEETGVDKTQYHTIPNYIITENNHNNKTGKLYNIAYSVGITNACHPLKGEEGKGQPEWMPFSKVLQLLDLEGLERSPVRKQAFLFSLTLKNMPHKKMICV
jgi:8-oxo-dGTP pyrophosphatase MutT (NUDIX family)